MEKGDGGMQAKRYEELDFVKAVAMMVVIYCHCFLLPTGSLAVNISMLMTASAVPCFFMCSGYVGVLKPVAPKQQLKKAGKIYLVIVVWKALYLAFYLGFRYWSVYDRSLRSVLAYLLLFQPLRGVTVGHFWFMEAYLTMLLLMPLINLLFQHKISLAVWAAVLCYFSNQFFQSAGVVAEILESMIGKELPALNGLEQIMPFGKQYHYILLYVLLGGLLRVAQESRWQKYFRNPLWFLICLSIGVGVLLCLYRWRNGSWYWTGKLLDDTYKQSATIPMTVGLFGVLQWMGTYKWFRKIGRTIGRNTQGIFYLHAPALEIVVAYMLTIWPADASVWLNIVKTAVVTLACWGGTVICRKIPVVRHLFQ